MLDDGFPAFLLQHHPKMMEAVVQTREDKGAVVTRKVRYRPKPIIESVGPKKIPPEYLAFIEESTFESREAQARVQNVPTVAGVARHLSNRGTMTFRDAGGECERVTQGELEITNSRFSSVPSAPSLNASFTARLTSFWTRKPRFCKNSSSRCPRPSANRSGRPRPSGPS